MQRKFWCVVVAFSFAVLAAPALMAGNGPSDKVTGNVQLQEADWGDPWFDFSAHEPKTEQETAKGFISWYSEFRDRALEFDVKYVKIEGQQAWFAAICTYDSWGNYEGRWLFVQVYDGGSPASNGDEWLQNWLAPDATEQDAEDLVETMATPLYEKLPIDGEVKVHNH